MISFYVGKADTDVSGKIRSVLADLLRSDICGQRIIYIIPEQFEYETERAVYKLLKDNGLLHKMSVIEITTFTALSSDILSENDVDRPRADDIVKNVLMHKAVSDCRGELDSLAGIIDKPGFCEKITATVTSFRSLGLSSRDVELSVEEMRRDDIAKNNPVIFKKLENVSLLYTEYDALMKEKGYLDNMDVIGMAAELIRKTTKFSGADVFVDSFNDFTNHQLRFLCEVIPQAKTMSFGFVTDYDDNSELFKTANSHISRLIEQAKANDVQTKIISGGLNSRYTENSALGELPRLLFQSKKSTKNIADACEIISAREIFDELDFVCAKIKQLADSGMRYRDIAVLCTDVSACQRYIESAFSKYEIPIFLDMHESVIGQPLINAVISLLTALRGFSADTVLSCIKTRFFTKYSEEKKERVGLSDNDINIFENYLFEWALSTEDLKKPFTFSDPYLKGKTDCNMLAAEEIRRTAVEPLWKFSKELPHGKNKIDGAKLTEMIYNYLINTVGIAKALFAKCSDPGTGEQDGDRTALYQRLWDTLIRIFDTLYDELKGVDITLDEYCRLFRDICMGTTLADPPQMVDRVLIGDIDRTRADNIKAAFIVGASFDLFPTPSPQTGIFSQYETELLRESVTHNDGSDKRELCFKTAKEQFSLSLYRAYKAVCLPTEYLSLSFSEIDPAGEPMHISTVSEEICGMFPDMQIKRASDFGDEFYCRSVSSAKLRFAMTANDSSEENAVLGEALRKNGCDGFVDQITELKNERAAKFAGDHRISAETAELLFPTKVGATEIEKMSACKFNFFCERGLGIRERTQRIFTPIKRGDAIHYAMEKILECYSADIPRFCTLTRRDLLALSRKFLEDFCRIETNNNFFEDARSRFLFNNIANSAADVLITMQTEFSARRYRPKFFELDLNGKDPKFIIDNDDLISAVLPEAALYIDDENAAESVPSTGKDPVLSKRAIYTAPLSIPLDNGKTLLVSGKIDRVDMFEEADTIYVRTVDYKSSVRTFDIENAKHGVNIQMLMYLSALLDANSSNRAIRLTAGGISYIPSESSGALDSPLKPYRLLALKHRPSGLVILNEVTKNEYSGYENSVINRITQEDGMTDELSADETTLTAEQKKERAEYKDELTKIRKLLDLNDENNLDEEKFAKFLSEVKTNVGKNYSDLMNGNICAVPLEYSEAVINLEGTKNNNKIACKYCRFKEICKNNGKSSLNIRKSSKASAKKTENKKTDGKRSNKKETAE